MAVSGGGADGMPRHAPARCHFHREKALLANANQAPRPARHREVLNRGAAFIQHEPGAAPLSLQPLCHRDRPGAAHLLIMAKPDMDGALRREALCSRVSIRGDEHHKEPFMSSVPRPPDIAIGNRAGEGWILPLVFGARLHRHHILVGRG